MTRIAVVALTVTIAACAGARSEQGSPSSREDRNAATASSDAARAVAGAQAAPSAAQDMSAICPMDVPGTTAAASDTADGEAITFTTTSGQVDELRRRVHALADMHNQHMSAAPAVTAPGGAPGTTPGAAEGTGSGAGESAMAHHPDHGMMSHSRAMVEDVDNGARVSISASDPAHVDQLRSAVRAHAMQMSRAGCGMAHPAGPRG